jgi:hypothetical protein
LLSGVLTCALPSAHLSAQCEVQSLVAPEVGALDEFGVSVSISGELAAVGARSSQDRNGAAYVFRFDGSKWAGEQRLTASGLPPRFGTSIAVSGDLIVVGATHVDNLSGAAYVFGFDGSRWIEQQKLTASDAPRHVFFGHSVATADDLLVVGAFGAAYVFRFDGFAWIEEQRLIAPDGGVGWEYRASVAVNSDLICVGYPGMRCSGFGLCGATIVYRFNGSTWIQEQQLFASDRAQFSSFGLSVAADSNILVVGAWGVDCPAGRDCGAAYVFRFNGLEWIEEQKIAPVDPIEYEYFGGSVAVGEDVVLVGADSGNAAYVFDWNGLKWAQDQKLVPSDELLHARFGWSVALSDELVVVGSYGDFCASGWFCGSAYIFALGPDCNKNGQADFCDIRDAGMPDTDHDGVPDECEPLVATLDIKPGACPNPFNPRSRGIVPAAIAGKITFDVREIDHDSLELRRADGVGGSVRPLNGPPGPGFAIADVTSHSSDETSDCHLSPPDGIDDLILKFLTPEFVESLQLASLTSEISVLLTLTGRLLDGTPITASDCILISGPPGTQRFQEVKKIAP